MKFRLQTNGQLVMKTVLGIDKSRIKCTGILYFSVLGIALKIKVKLMLGTIYFMFKISLSVICCMHIVAFKNIASTSFILKYERQSGSYKAVQIAMLA